MSQIYDSIVIGAGPAGMTAALYLLRANKSVLLLEGNGIGGQIALSPRLENYPSIPSISGAEFADNLFSQINDLGVEFDLATVSKIEKRGDVYVLFGESGEEYQAKAVIVAAGCQHRLLNLPNEKRLTGRGISYCAACDGAFYQNKNVVVIGDGNSALQYAITLSKICARVELVTLFDRYFADDILIKRLEGIPNIHARHNRKAIEFVGEEDLEAILFVNQISGETESIPCDGCFIAIGQVPSNEPFLPYVVLEDGFILTDECGQTKTPGLFAAGDCRKKEVRQVATAVGDGANAAMVAIKYLDTHQS